MAELKAFLKAFEGNEATKTTIENIKNIENSKPLTNSEIIARAFTIVHKTLEEIEETLEFLQEENEILEMALSNSLRFYTVIEYNKVFKMDWSAKQCQEIAQGLTAFCWANSIKIKLCETDDKRFNQVYTYPLTAWERYLKRMCANE